VGYNGSVPLEERVEQVLDWVALPRGERPVFLSLYAGDVDGAGHVYGPESKEVDEAIVKVDNMLGLLWKGLAKRKLESMVNLVVVSDHGMAPNPQDTEHWVFLDDYIDTNKVNIIYQVMLGLYPKDTNETAALYSQLLKASLDNPEKFKVYNTTTVPAEFSHPTRTPPITVLPQPGWGVSLRSTFKPGKQNPVGVHGYDPSDPNMGAVFIAVGPAFKRTNSTMDWRKPALTIGASKLSSSPSQQEDEPTFHILPYFNSTDEANSNQTLQRRADEIPTASPMLTPTALTPTAATGPLTTSQTTSAEQTIDDEANVTPSTVLTPTQESVVPTPASTTTINLATTSTAP
ncbi:hypothetical protein HDV05_002748, partial [Chytridiales sp. JEL 0842]